MRVKVRGMATSRLPPAGSPQSAIEPKHCPRIPQAQERTQGNKAKEGTMI